MKDYRQECIEAAANEILDVVNREDSFDPMSAICAILEDFLVKAMT